MGKRKVMINHPIKEGGKQKEKGEKGKWREGIRGPDEKKGSR